MEHYWKIVLLVCLLATSCRSSDPAVEVVLDYGPDVSAFRDSNASFTTHDISKDSAPELWRDLGGVRAAIDGGTLLRVGYAGCSGYWLWTGTQQVGRDNWVAGEEYLVVWSGYRWSVFYRSWWIY